MKQITGILLAAGQSHRFGSNKLLAPLDDGQPMLLRSLRNLQSVLSNIIVVVPEASPKLVSLLQKEQVSLVENPLAGQGMGTSIACGVKAASQQNAANHVQTGGWLIALGDMPFIKPDTIKSVLQNLTHERAISAPIYEPPMSEFDHHYPKRGHPVAFGVAYQDELLALSRDRGAKEIIKANQQHLVLQPCLDAGVLLDIDRPDDLNCFENQFAQPVRHAHSS